MARRIALKYIYSLIIITFSILFIALNHRNVIFTEDSKIDGSLNKNVSHVKFRREYDGADDLVKERLATYSKKYTGQVGCKNIPELSQHGKQEFETASKILNRLNRELVEYPIDGFHGRGIVFSAGEPQIPLVETNLKIMDRLSIKLPIEIWYSQQQVNFDTLSEVLKRFPKLNLAACSFENNECRSLKQSRKLNSKYVYAPPNDFFLLKNFRYKPAAIISSTFREVLFLDCDSYLVRDPTPLFDDPLYKHFGALFYPDGYQSRQNPFLWGFLETTCGNDEYELDSAMILVDKKLVWKGLHMTKLINDNHKYFYGFVSDGDKDTFRIGFRYTHVPYYLVMIPCSTGNFDGKYFCGHTLCKTDSLGKHVYVNHAHLFKYENMGYSIETLGYTRIGLVDPNNTTVILEHCIGNRAKTSCFHIRISSNTVQEKNSCNFDNISPKDFETHKYGKDETLLNRNLRFDRVIISETNNLLPDFVDNLLESLKKSSKN